LIPRSFLLEVPMKAHRLIGTLATVSLTFSLAAAAQAAIVESQHPGGVRSLQGGVGEAEQQQMKAAAADYSLGLTFAADSGAYLADVAVRVLDAKGRTVFDTTVRNPIVLVDLPAGRYSIEATYQGRTQRSSVTLAQGKSRAVTLRWRDGDAPAAAMATPQR
jgi:hypothetical protein